MTCSECGEKQRNSLRPHEYAAVEINNPSELILFHRVDIPASMGDEAQVPPVIGKYKNVLLHYEATGTNFLYSSDGIPTKLTSTIPDEILARLEALEEEDVTLHNAIEDEADARELADASLSSSIESLSSSLSSETTAREQADAALNTAITSEVAARQGADTNLQSQIDAIEAVIPEQASAQNQLADKNFVNSSVATNTAYFVGTFNSLAELEAVQNPSNNDYGFVVTTDAQGNTVYNRYKYTSDTNEWLFEYALNNSSFTAAQWATINSGITSTGATKAERLPTSLVASIDTPFAYPTLVRVNYTKKDLNTGDSSNVSAYLYAATQSAAGVMSAADKTKLNGLADIQTIGANLTLANGELSATDTIYTAGTGIDITNNVISVTSTGPTVVQTTGTSTTDVMSQKATTDMVYQPHLGSYPYSMVRIGEAAYVGNLSGGVAIGQNSRATESYAVAIASTVDQSSRALASGNSSVALGTNSTASGAGSIAIRGTASAHGSIAIGRGANATRVGEMNIGAGSYTANGYNNSAYRLLSGLYDGQNDHDAVTVGQMNAAIAAAGGAEEISAADWSALWQ